MSMSKAIKCMVVGDVLIGKSSFLLKIITNELPDSWRPTVFDNYTLDVRLPRGIQLLSLWDTCKSCNFL